MNIKAKILKRAIAALNDVSMPDHAEIDISVREEDFSKDKLGSCVTLTATWSKRPPNYDRNQNEINVVAIVEVFPDSEGMPPRWTVTESRNLE